MQSQNDPPEKAGHVRKCPHMPPDPSVSAIHQQLESTCAAKKNSGRIRYMGVFASGGRQSEWACSSVNTDQLLTLIENGTVEKVLACIGSHKRLNLLLTLLKKPMPVAQLVEEGGYHSTGQVYHHLKPLLAADLVSTDTRGDKQKKDFTVLGRTACRASSCFPPAFMIW